MKRTRELYQSLLDIPRQPTCMKLGTRELYQSLLDIPRQPTCMKLGTTELYQPIQSCHVVCLGISNKPVAVP